MENPGADNTTAEVRSEAFIHVVGHLSADSQRRRDAGAVRWN
jgi:hypothetical protein